MQNTNFRYVFRSIENNKPAVEEFLHRLFNSLSCPLPKEKLQKLLDSYQVIPGEDYISSIRRVIDTKVELYRDEQRCVTAYHSVNDPQEKVVDYAYCFLEFKKGTELLQMHWGNFVQGTRLADILMAELKMPLLNLGSILEYGKEFTYALEPFYQNISYFQPDSLKSLLAYCEASDLPEKAMEFKSSAKIIDSFQIAGADCDIIELLNYDGIYLDPLRYLSFSAISHPLFYQLFSKWDIKNAPQTIGLEGDAVILDKVLKLLN